MAEIIDYTTDLDLTQPGPLVIRKMPADVYHALPRLNASKVAAFARSTLHGAAEVAKEYDMTMDKAFGTAAHARILEPLDFEARAKEIEGIGPGAIVTYRKACEEFPDEIVLARGWRERIEGVREGIRRLPRVNRLMFDHGAAERELTILWTEQLRGEEIPCKARIDFLDTERGTVVDLKTTNDSSHGKFERTIGDLRYHVKGCWYRRGVMVAGLASEPALMWVACETTAPFMACGYPAGEDLIEQGWAEACLGVHRYMAWKAKRRDPYPPPEIMTVTLPPWQRIDPESLTAFTEPFTLQTA